MNYKIIEQNPLEAIRLTERISQAQFSVKLGYPNKHQYSHHMRNFTQDIIDKVLAVYDRDITMDIINHLKFECRKLKKLNKVLEKNQPKTELKAKETNQSISSLLEKI
ncbi:MAG: hypothetical protein P9L97_03495 [Candidatus Tenebribacter davisii]|jgi:putative cell wall-binding protein|nr:hypothetical protein [Candidatus Tenebribacter davisii]